MITVILPTYNRIDQLKMVLSGLDQQTFPKENYEVIVISDGSTDGTNQYLCNLQTQFRLKIITQDNQGVACARNAGIHSADGEIVVFLDDDTIPVKEFLVEHHRHHEQYGTESIILGPMFAPPSCNLSPWVSWELSRLKEQYRDMVIGRWQPSPRQFYTANASIARRHLLEVGGFDPAFRRAEDVELAYRLERRGLRFVFNPNAVVYHYAKRSFESWIAIPYDYGVNDVVFAYQKEQSWLLPTIFSEYHQRHPLVKMLARLCLKRNFFSYLAQLALKKTILITHKLGLNNLSHLACGGMFNLRYYQGVTDSLGSRQAFFARVKDATLT